MLSGLGAEDTVRVVVEQRRPRGPRRAPAPQVLVPRAVGRDGVSRAKAAPGLGAADRGPRALGGGARRVLAEGAAPGERREPRPRLDHRPPGERLAPPAARAARRPGEGRPRGAQARGLRDRGRGRERRGGPLAPQPRRLRSRRRGERRRLPGPVVRGARRRRATTGTRPSRARASASSSTTRPPRSGRCACPASSRPRTP